MMQLVCNATNKTDASQHLTGTLAAATKHTTVWM